jgi:hypothetical protein
LPHRPELKIENDQLILKRTPVLPVSTEYTVLLPAGRAFQGSKTMAFALDRDTEEVILPPDQKRKI